MIIYAVITYGYDNYSYLGTSERDRQHFLTREKAEQWAKDHGYTVTKWFISDKDNPDKVVEIEEITVHE